MVEAQKASSLLLTHLLLPTPEAAGGPDLPESITSNKRSSALGILALTDIRANWRVSPVLTLRWKVTAPKSMCSFLLDQEATAIFVSVHARELLIGKMIRKYFSYQKRKKQQDE